MPEEIQQPEITKPKLNDPCFWALEPRLHAEWIRKVSSQLGVEVEKYIIGHVLERIIGDDVNCFAWTFGDAFFFSDMAVRAKRNLIERMDWEVTTPETPSMIKERLKLTSQKILSLDWSHKDGFDQAKAEWYGFKEWAKRQINEDPELKKAEAYYLATNDRILKHWKDFIRG